MRRAEPPFGRDCIFHSFPKLHKLDLRAEAVVTDPRVTRANGGNFFYWEVVQLQGYTNKGFIMGD